MQYLTVCPHYLANYNNGTPREIEGKIILPLRKCFLAAKEHDIKIIIAKEILEDIKNSYPWHLMHDSTWKGYLLSWHILVIEWITKHADIVAVKDSANIVNLFCNQINQNINNIFINFIHEIGDINLPRGLSDFSIFSSNDCGTDIYFNKYYSLTDTNNIHYVKHPWLRIYTKNLPPEGEYPFVPPENWRLQATPAKGPNHGYLDSNGNEWVWDHLHENHWDVQINGKHINVTSIGKIL